MFEWLFPGWTAPWFLTLLVSLRTLCNVALTTSIGEASDSRLAVAAGAALTLASLVLTVGVLRGTFGITVSHVESILQVALLVLTGVVVARGDAVEEGGGDGVGEGSGDGRRRALVAGAAAVVLYLFSIPLFGEATVAP